jgi:hypothetical protein
MGLMDIANKYEKMLENPANRTSSAGRLKQQKPSLAEAQGAGSSNTAPTVEDADDIWVKELDKRMAARKQRLKERVNESTSNAGTNQLLQEMKEVKEMLKMVLDANLQLMEKLK